MLTADRLRELIHYDPDTGEFTWIVDRYSCAGQRMAEAGTAAGSFNPKGYRQICIGRTYGAHRLAWLYVTGEFPKNQIDHRNGNKADNRFVNLREATNSENCQNRGVRKNNALGVTGVYRRGKRFAAHVTQNGKQFNLGTFASLADAKAIRDLAAADLHREFAFTTTGGNSDA